MEKLPAELLEQLLGQLKHPKDVDSLYSQLLQGVINRSLDAEMDVHLGYEKHHKAEDGRRHNSRNGKTTKRLKGTFGEIEIETPRDRDGSFEPQLIGKRQVRLDGMEEKIMALYSRGMTTRDIESALMDLYGVTVSHSVISQVTEAVLEEVEAWRNRPLEKVYPIVWVDGISLKVRQERQVGNHSCHVILAVNMQGEKEVLGIWMAETEGAKFWHAAMVELQNRGVQDIFIACMDGLVGLPQAVNAVFPKALTQRCIVHMVRASLRYVAAKDRQLVVDAMRQIYTAVSEQEATAARDLFEQIWGKKYPGAVNLWKSNWADIIPFLQFPPAIRKVVYTTNAIESLNMVMRKLTRNRRIFPSDNSALKSIYLTIRMASKKWGKMKEWKAAIQSFQILFGEERVNQ